MNTLINMNPWRFLDEMLDIDSRAFKSIRARAAGRFPPVNVMLDDGAVIIDVELPGKTAKDVELTLEPQSVTIAERPKEAADGETATTAAAEAPEEKAKSECTWRRRLELPFRVDQNKANAKFANGILRIELPRADATLARRITIAE